MVQRPVLPKVDSAADQHCDVEDLVACSAVIKRAWLAPFRAPEDVVAGSSDVDGATDPEPPRAHWYFLLRWVLVQEDEKCERSYTCKHEHNAPHRSVLCLIKLLDECDSDTGQVKYKSYDKAGPLQNTGSIASKPVNDDWHRTAKNEHRNSAIVQSGKHVLSKLGLHAVQVKCRGTPKAEDRGDNVG